MVRFVISVRKSKMLFFAASHDYTISYVLYIKRRNDTITYVRRKVYLLSL